MAERDTFNLTNTLSQVQLLPGNFYRTDNPKHSPDTSLYKYKHTWQIKPDHTKMAGCPDSEFPPFTQCQREEGNPAVGAHYRYSTSRTAALASVLEHFQWQVSRTFSDSSEGFVTFATTGTLTVTQWHSEIRAELLSWKALLSFQ